MQVCFGHHVASSAIHWSLHTLGSLLSANSRFFLPSMDSIFDLIFEFASVNNSSQCEDSLSKLKNLLKTEDMPDQCRPHGHKIRLSGWCRSEMNDTGMLRDCLWDCEMCQKHDLSAHVSTFAEDTSQCMVRIHDRSLQHSSCSHILTLEISCLTLVL